MINLSIFSERLKELMFYKNLKYKDLAKNIGVARSTVSELARGEFLPSYKTFVRIIEYFNCSADFLLGRTDKNSDNFKAVQPFGERLRFLLENENKSQYGLEKFKQISGSIVYEWLTNKYLPSLENLVKVAEYFDHSVDYVLGREN